jgi:hypothetical protein
MIARGDRHHDIAAWFGVNQGRIADAQDGKYGTPDAAPLNELPPQGAPGVKGRRLRSALDEIGKRLADGDLDGAKERLTAAVQKYDANEG